MLDPDLVRIARSLVASTKNVKPKEVVAILEGEWDHTPAIKHAYGCLWKQRQALEADNA